MGSMNTIFRIGILSFIMSIYMCWAFRGIEYDVMEILPAVVGFFLAFTICAIIAGALYNLMKKPDEEALYKFIFLVWAASASVVTVGWLIFYAQDTAAAGEFRDNVIIGGVIMAVMVGILNYAVAYALSHGMNYLKPKRRQS